MPTSYKSLKYALCSIDFDSETASFGKVDTLVRSDNESVTMPRMSPDGRYMLYTSTAYGNFTVWHKDADLVLVDLESGERHEAADWNSDEAESYHSWSSNGRWLVFVSRRDDGLYSRPYIAFVDKDGTAHKPFVVPQASPEYYLNSLKSYNVPEFIAEPVTLERREIIQMAQEGMPVKVTVRQ
jgi:dipeptidyl aminopeptidase/acylaminoacyl peptidase